MSAKVAGNVWGEIVHHEPEGILELRWLPTEMTDGAFKATLALFALEAERVGPSFLLIDATQFRHRFGPGVMQWRDDCIIPRYGAAGARKFAFHVPADFPNTMEAGGKEVVEGPAIFPTAWFSDRQHALAGFRTAERPVASRVRENAMSPMSAAALASVLSFAVFAIMAGWYVAPWLATRQRAEALVPLLWVHAFRHIALQIFSAQRFGFAVSDGARDQIAAGDVTGMVLAVISIVALHYRARVAPLLVWVFVAETVFDLVNATIAGVREQLFATASGVTWLILTFYVPLLWVSLALIVWQLYVRRRGPLSLARA